MNVTCPNCATVYRVDPAKVPEAGVRARCAVCSAVFAVQREPAPRASTPVAAAAQYAPPPAAMPASTPTPAAGSPRVGGPTAAPSAAVPPRPAMPPRPAAPLSPMMPPAPAAPPVSRPPAQSPSAPEPPRAAPPAAPRPVVNPFLSQDPALKAKRLARALISDMVVYHPAKRQEGLRDGTLKQLFDEEIKKSWEEYTEQVGRDVAESTAYFREALNEILAGGKQLF